MRFHTFEVSVNQVDYDRPDENGNPLQIAKAAHKICLNLEELSSIEQLGQWVRNPDQPRPSRARDRAHRSGEDSSETFVIYDNRFVVNMKKGGRSFTVMGDFHEFASLLTAFQNERETVND